MPKTWRPWMEKEVALVVALVRCGQSAKEVATRMNEEYPGLLPRTPNAVLSLCSRLEISLVEIKWDRWVTLFQSGLTVKEIASRLDVTIHTVYQMRSRLTRKGYEVRPVQPS